MPSSFPLSVFVLSTNSRKKVKPLLMQEACELPTSSSSFCVCGCVELEAMSLAMLGCALPFSTINHIDIRSVLSLCLERPHFYLCSSLTFIGVLSSCAHPLGPPRRTRVVHVAGPCACDSPRKPHGLPPIVSLWFKTPVVLPQILHIPME